jgi:hypothetical protein
MTYQADPPKADVTPISPPATVEASHRSTIVAVVLGIVGIFAAAYVLY